MSRRITSLLVLVLVLASTCSVAWAGGANGPDPWPTMIVQLGLEDMWTPSGDFLWGSLNAHVGTSYESGPNGQQMWPWIDSALADGSPIAPFWDWNWDGWSTMTETGWAQMSSWLISGGANGPDPIPTIIYR